MFPEALLEEIRACGLQDWAALGQMTGWEHSPTCQQTAGLKIY